jgi:hypothetical protein
MYQKIAIHFLYNHLFFTHDRWMVAYQKLISNLCFPSFFNHNLKGTFSVKFEIYMHQTIIFKGVLNNYLTFFLTPYYYLLYIDRKPTLY